MGTLIISCCVLKILVHELIIRLLNRIILQFASWNVMNSIYHLHNHLLYHTALHVSTSSSLLQLHIIKNQMVPQTGNHFMDPCIGLQLITVISYPSYHLIFKICTRRWQKEVRTCSAVSYNERLCRQ